jgi:hypothetical protein
MGLLAAPSSPALGDNAPAIFSHFAAAGDADAVDCVGAAVGLGEATVGAGVGRAVGAGAHADNIASKTISDVTSDTCLFILISLMNNVRSVDQFDCGLAYFAMPSIGIEGPRSWVDPIRCGGFAHYLALRIVSSLYPVAGSSSRRKSTFGKTAITISAVVLIKQPSIRCPPKVRPNSSEIEM